MEDLKNKLQKNKGSVITLSVIILIFLVLWYLGKGEEPLLNLGERVTIEEIDGAKLLVELERLKSLNQIDGEFLQSPLFKSLVDSQVQVSAQPIGRKNPFSPPAFD